MMGLVLTRRENQAFHIDDDIVITITKVHGKQARINIEAPPNRKIYREEIYKRIQEEKGGQNDNQ